MTDHSEAAAFSLAAEMLASLTLPRPFSVRAFLNQLAERRGKPIVLHRVPVGWSGRGGWCGAWLDTNDADHVFFVEDQSTLKTAQTVLHEAGHVVFDHPGQPVPASVSLAGVPRSAVTRARGRSDFEEFDELTAEAFSTLVLQACTFGPGVDLSVPEDPRAALLSARLG
jgi:hypothetical protein